MFLKNSRSLFHRDLLSGFHRKLCKWVLATEGKSLAVGLADGAASSAYCSCPLFWSNTMLSCLWEARPFPDFGGTNPLPSTKQVSGSPGSLVLPRRDPDTFWVDGRGFVQPKSGKGELNKKQENNCTRVDIWMNSCLMGLRVASGSIWSRNMEFIWCWGGWASVERGGRGQKAQLHNDFSHWNLSLIPQPLYSLWPH